MEKSFDIGVGDKVWLMHNNHIVSGVVSKVWYTKFISPIDYESIVESEWYSVHDEKNKRIDSFRKEGLFPTKTELIKSL